MTKLVVKFQTGGSTGTTGAVQSGFAQSNTYGMIAQGIGGLVSKFPTPNAELNSNNQMAAQARDGISNALLASGNPYAMAAGAAVKVIDKTGGFSDVSEGLGTDNDIGNAIMSFALPGAGWFMPKTDEYKMSADMKVMSNAYAGAVKDAGKAQSNSGAKLWFGRDKANRMIAEAKARDNKISDIKQAADVDFQTARSMTQNKAMSNQYALMGGYHQAYARAGKFGLKLERAKQLAIKLKEPSEIKEQKEVYVMKDGGEFFNKIKEEFIPTTEEQNKEFFENLIPEFKEGGQMNVIPEGSLHARLHHMENADNLTKKGIPVVDNEGNQQAEIEHSEIIFTKEVTEKLEELYKKFKSDEYTNKEKEGFAIEAGKLLSKEIIENTDDRVGLLNDNENETLANN